ANNHGLAKSSAPVAIQRNDDMHSQVSGVVIQHYTDIHSRVSGSNYTFQSESWSGKSSAPVVIQRNADIHSQVSGGNYTVSERIIMVWLVVCTSGDTALH
ncbi:hypothetical protein J6590_088217, partial [Homalodisca vitripennis]